MKPNEIVLTGLDGANPLAFLAALGTLRLLDSSLQCEGPVLLSWRRAIVWHPVLSGPSVPATPRQLCEALLAAAPIPAAALRQHLGKNINVAPGLFRSLVQAADAALPDRSLADFTSSLGSEACIDARKNKIHYTALCFITGSGHQDFVETACALLAQTRTEHLHEALFGPWRRSDKGLSFRWDPADAAEHALQWEDPSAAGASSVWGANRLAVEALPFFPCQPGPKTLGVTAFLPTRDGGHVTWPLWQTPLSCDVIRSLLSSELLQDPQPDRSLLAAMGILEVFRSARVRIGQGANFKVSFRPAKSV